MHPSNPCDHSAVAFAMMVNHDPGHRAPPPGAYSLRKPHVRLHVSMGKHSGGLYWWFTRRDDPDPYSVLNQRHTTVAKAWAQFATRCKLGLV